MSVKLHKLIPIVVVVCTAATVMLPRAACASDAEQTIGVGPFHKLRVDGNAEVTLRAGDAERVTVRGSENQQQDVRVDVEVRGGELHIRSRPHQANWLSSILEPARGRPRITVVFRNLDTVELAGAVRLRAESLRVPKLAIGASGAVSIKVDDLRTDELSIHGSGAMKARLAGRAARQQIVLAGAGKYDAPDLVSEDAQVDVSGAGRVILRADKTLRVSLAGAGAVDYLGEPQITRDITGAGRLRPYKASLLKPPRGGTRLIAAARAQQCCRA